MSEDFLSRWSRRKRQAERQEPESSRAQGAETEPPRAAAAPVEAAPPQPAAAAEAALSEEEIARLPSLDELTADTDITVFLRKGVPERLRNAALRRMWSLDPKIRDFVCEAREYAYDWNTPDGIPGFGGPLPPAEEVQKLAARIVGAIQPEAAQPPEADAEKAELAISQTRESSSTDVDANVSAVSQQGASGSQPPSPVRIPQRAETLAREPFATERTKVAEGPDLTAAQQSGAQQELKLQKPRRHGGAKPL